MIQQGILTQHQVELAVAEQRLSGEPFGVACERLFGLHPKVVEGAWALQYATLVSSVDPKLNQIEPDAEALMTRRQAWQFRSAPLRFENGQVVIVTCAESLARALRFATTHIAHEVFLVLVSPERLAAHLQERFPMIGMDEEIIRRWFKAA